MSKPTVSVIIPTYNCASTIGNCLNPLLTGYIDDIEIIICDDGSTDCTWDVLAKYRHKNSKICKMTKHDTRKGFAATLNNAIQYADGTWITFANANDLTMQCGLLRLLTMTQDNTEMVIGNAWRQEAGGGFELGYWNKWLDYTRLAALHWDEYHRLQTLYSIGGGLYDKLFKMDFWRHHNFRFCENVADDYDTLLILETVHKANHVAFQCLPSYYQLYRKTPLTQSISLRTFYDGVRLIDSINDEKTKIVIALRMLRIAYYYGVYKAPDMKFKTEYITAMSKHPLFDDHFWSLIDRCNELPFIPKQWHEESLDLSRYVRELQAAAGSAIYFCSIPDTQ